MPNTYDTDFGLWARAQAQALRSAAETASNLPIDWENVAEEIEGLAKNHERELASRISTILVHLIKLQASPATDPHPGWRRTVRTQRREIERLLKGEATLQKTVPAVIDDELQGAKEQALGDLADYDEMPSVDVTSIAFTEDQVLGWWFP